MQNKVRTLNQNNYSETESTVSALRDSGGNEVYLYFPEDLTAERRKRGACSLGPRQRQGLSICRMERVLHPQYLGITEELAQGSSEKDPLYLQARC